MSVGKAEVIDAVITTASHKDERSSRLQRGFSILLFCVFVVVDLLALVAGTSSYGSLTKMQQTNDARIMSLGPIVGSVRANDASGAVRKSSDAPEGDALVLVESDEQGTYETRIYLYEGNVVQEYALAGSPYTPTKATVLAQSSVFEFSYADGLLSVTTDAGTSVIALRNQQGGA